MFARQYALPFLIFFFLLFGVRFYQTHKPIVRAPYNYSFAYTVDGMLWVYDLKTDIVTRTSLGIQEPVSLQWSIENKLAVYDAKGNLYITRDFKDFAHPESHITGPSTLFWNKLGTGVYYTTFYGTNAQAQDEEDPKPIYDFAIEKGTKEVGKADFSKAFDQLLASMEEKVSFDGTYVADTDYIEQGNSKVSLIYAPSHKIYFLPDASWKPRISQENTYLVVKDNTALQAQSPVSIYTLKDVLKRDFTPLYRVEGIYDYEWIDDDRLGFIRQTINPSKVAPAPVTYHFSIYSVKTGQAQTLFSITEFQHAFTNIHISPDKKRLAYIGETPDYRGALVIYSFEENKILKTIPYDTGAWSNPL